MSAIASSATEKAVGGSRPLLARLFPKLWEESSFLREYLWKYRALVAIGLLTLVVVDVLEVLPPILLKQAVDVAIEGAQAARLWWLAGAYLGIAILQGFCRYGWRMYLIQIGRASCRERV